jgi:hypothetical protein
VRERGREKGNERRESDKSEREEREREESLTCSVGLEVDSDLHL